MGYSCLEELQTILDLHMSDKTKVLSNAGYKYDNNGWFVVTDDGHCHLFDKDGNLDDIKKIKHLEENFIRKDIKKIIIPDSIVSIRNDTFYGCCNITHLTIPNSVTDIWIYAFRNCSGLTSVTIPNSVTSIKYMTFRSCINLKSIMIPNSVTNIGDYVFYKCDALSNIIFKGKTFKQVKKMKNYPFGIKDKSIIKCVE